MKGMGTMVGSVLRIAAGTALAALLAGCSMGSMFGGSDDASYANINASQTQVAQAASGAMPAIATEGNITMPLRFAVQRDGLAVFSQRYDVAVAASPSSANEFSQTVENVAIPYVGGEQITIFVGFDN